VPCGAIFKGVVASKERKIACLGAMADLSDLLEQLGSEVIDKGSQ
jgi:hypothetical protein